MCSCHQGVTVWELHTSGLNFLSRFHTHKKSSNLFWTHWNWCLVWKVLKWQFTFHQAAKADCRGSKTIDCFGWLILICNVVGECYLLVLPFADNKVISSEHATKRQRPHCQYNITGRKFWRCSPHRLLCIKIWCNWFKPCTCYRASWNGKKWNKNDMCSTVYRQYWTCMASKVTVSG